MRLEVIIVCFLCISTCHVVSNIKHPTILISFLARNKAHTLPYFLTALENLDYPKNRISLWIRTDHNIDETNDILCKWIPSVESQYHSIHFESHEDYPRYIDENGPGHWTLHRFNHVINLRENALNHARKVWADYFLTIDCDVFLTNRNTLHYLIDKNLTVVSPMLRSESLYSNFWYGMTEDYYYQRTDDYKPVLERQNKGCFEVPMIHSCVLINLNRAESDHLTYIPNKLDFDGPVDDIIIFAISANQSNTPLNLCNEEIFGYVTVPMEQDDQLEIDFEQLRNIKLEAIADDQALQVSDILREFVSVPQKDTMGFDKIFMINLARRPERRKKMLACFDELGMNVTLANAIDGKLLDESELGGISFLPEYVDPYHKRPMTLGEIGCFLSHYNVWKEIVDKGYTTTLVLEDDIRFEPFFRTKVFNVMAEVRRLPDWDLIYFGRKRLQESEEPYVEGSKILVEAGYSYWTLGYALSFKGAKKLLDANPLSKLVPVDEYLPMLFDKHPQVNWKRYFPNRNLQAFSAAPLLLYPTHYTGEPGYISDTEDSTTIKPDVSLGHEDL